jgi:hypothetical protein
MAKFGSAARASKSEKRKRMGAIVMGVLLLSLMVVAIFSYGDNANQNLNPNVFEYNGFDFEAKQLVDGGVIFVVEKDGLEVGQFYNHPSDTANLVVSDEFKSVWSTSPKLILTSEVLSLESTHAANSDRAYQDYLIKDLEAGSQKTILRGYLSKDFFGEFPVYTCDDAAFDSPVLILNSTIGPEGVGIFNEETPYCFSLHASSIDIFKFRDRLFYLSLGVQI